MQSSTWSDHNKVKRCVHLLLDLTFRLNYLFSTNTLSPTLHLKSPENFGKSADREVPFFATFGLSLRVRFEIFFAKREEAKYFGLIIWKEIVLKSGKTTWTQDKKFLCIRLETSIDCHCSLGAFTILQFSVVTLRKSTTTILTVGQMVKNRQKLH